MTPAEAMERINELASHVWMVRTFLKHCDEAQEDDELMEVPRELYDYLHALGPAWSERDTASYLKLAKKKLGKLKAASEKYTALQPEISSHTNFQTAAHSLAVAVREIAAVLESLQAEPGSRS